MMFGLAGLAGLGMLSSIAQPVAEVISGASGLANFGSALGRGLSSVRGGGTRSGQSNVAMPSATAGSQAGTSNPDLDAIANMLFGDRIGKIVGALQRFKFHNYPTDIGDISYNAAYAKSEPNIGPGLLGLQTLIQAAGGGT